MRDVVLTACLSAKPVISTDPPGATKLPKYFRFFGGFPGTIRCSQRSAQPSTYRIVPSFIQTLALFPVQIYVFLFVDRDIP